MKSKDTKADKSAADNGRPMSVVKRNRGKFNFVRRQPDIVEANTKTIARLHKEVIKCERIGLEKALRIGELLFEQKKRVKHGKFTRWAAEYLPFDIRTAQNYMKLYRYKDELSAKRINSLSGAYAALKGEATPVEVIDADDSVDTSSKWEIVNPLVELDDTPLPKKKAKGMMTKLAIDKDVVSRMTNQEFPFKDSNERYVKIVVGVPNSKYQESSLVGDFVFAASKLLKRGGKLIFHKK